MLVHKRPASIELQWADRLGYVSSFIYNLKKPINQWQATSPPQLRLFIYHEEQTRLRLQLESSLTPTTLSADSERSGF